MCMGTCYIGNTPGQGLGNAVPQWRPGTPGPGPRAGATKVNPLDVPAQQKEKQQLQKQEHENKEAPDN
jgi:hypothetical protein